MIVSTSTTSSKAACAPVMYRVAPKSNPLPNDQKIVNSY